MAPKIKIPSQPKYFTTRQQATSALNQVGSDEPGYGLRFQAGRGYYLGASAPRSGLASAAAAAPASSDPYAALIAGMPQPYTAAQISKQANGQISPLMAAAMSAIKGQAANNAQAITGLSNSLADQLRSIDYTSPYSQGEQAQSAVDSALQASLNNAGSQDAADLSKRLASINDPAVAQAAAAVAQNGGANAGTQVAQGSNALANLIAEQAAAASYGQKQPGIAQLAGLQQLGNNNQQATQQIAQQTQALEAQLPSIIQSLQSESDNRAQAISAAKQNQIARSDALTTTTANNATKLSAAEIAAQTKATEDEVRQAQSDRAYRLQFAKTFGVDPVTGKITPGFAKNAKARS